VNRVNVIQTHIEKLPCVSKNSHSWVTVTPNPLSTFNFVKSYLKRKLQAVSAERKEISLWLWNIKFKFIFFGY